MWIYFLALILAWRLYIDTFQRRTNFPFVNHDLRSWTYRAAKKTYIKHARQLLVEGTRMFTGPFNLVTDSGPLIMLPPEYIDAVNAEKNLSFIAYVREENLAHFDTFRTMRSPPAGMFEEAVMKGITRALPAYTKPLSLEMSASLKETWGDATEWREVRIVDDALKWVARLSTRIFLGETFVNDAEWLRISEAFTVNLFTAMAATKAFSPFLRPLVDQISPLNRKVRADYCAAARLLRPTLKQRDDEIASAHQKGGQPNLPDDSIEWFRRAARGRTYDHVDVQLGLTVAAVHTTSDLLCQALLNLCAHPGSMQHLRAEAINILGRHGLRKTALTELRLLDSFLKETQRLKPIAMASMHRSATEDLELPGGVRIYKGEHTAISSHRMWDAEEYENPERFDPLRFVNRREFPGLENKSLLVSTSANHLGFSHGKHACPGRFFAANEVKIAMLHLLLKYDMRIDDPSKAHWQSYGISMMVNPNATLYMKARQPEVDLERLARIA